jgi:dethiobiotin synthetase
MSKGIFITATGTDIGKTYVTALLVKKLREKGLNAGYYKSALSGAKNVDESDAGYVNAFAGIGQDKTTLVSYLYENAVSPHLAAQIEGNPVDMQRVLTDFEQVKARYDYVVVEGSGGIVCPIRYDETAHIFLEDIIRAMELNTLIIADAGLGTINAVVLTVEYLRRRNIGVCGVILNRYTGGVMQDDNIKMIEAITSIPIIALVNPDETDLKIDIALLTTIFEEKLR